MESFQKRIDRILTVADEDPTAVKLINSVKGALVRYKEAITNYQRLSILRLRCFDGAEERELTVRLDRQKHTAHESLMSDIAITNRYLFRTYWKEIPAGGVYTEDPIHLYGSMDRHAIEAWAVKTAPTVM